MITFITSIRHPQNSSDYKKVEVLLERTLKSVCGQTNNDYCVIVVCNRLPLVQELSKVHYVQVDFSPPSSLAVAKTSIPAVLKDKSTKCYIGLIKAKEFNPDYIMFFDADDLIHNGIASYVNSNMDENGWYINKGFVYRNDGLLLSKVDNFNKVCGTSNILKFSLVTPDDSLKVTSSQEEIFNTVDNEYLFRILGDHQDAETWFREKADAPLKPFPFRAAIWVAETGENHSGVIFFGKPIKIAKDVATSFNLLIPNGIQLKLVTIFYYYPYGYLRAFLRMIKHLLLSR